MHFWFLRQDVNRLPAIYNRDLSTRCLFKMVPDSAKHDPDILVRALLCEVERRSSQWSGIRCERSHVVTTGCCKCISQYSPNSYVRLQVRYGLP